MLYERAWVFHVPLYLAVKRLYKEGFVSIANLKKKKINANLYIKHLWNNLKDHVHYKLIWNIFVTINSIAKLFSDWAISGQMIDMVFDIVKTTLHLSISQD